LTFQVASQCRFYDSLHRLIREVDARDAETLQL